MAEVYCQVGPSSVALRARLDLFEQLLSEPFYDTLRTKEQLGYSVHCSPRLTHGILGFALVVISGGHATSPFSHMSLSPCTAQWREQSALSVGSFCIPSCSSCVERQRCPGIHGR